jgi:hypothetical protein
VKRLWIIALIGTALLIAGCGGDDKKDDPPPDPLALLNESATKIRAAATFRLEVNLAGADYLFPAIIDDQEVDVGFRRAIGQYVAPASLQARVSIKMGILTLDVDIFAQGDDQWYKYLAVDWRNEDFTEDFNPQKLIAEDSGFQRALTAIDELEYLGVESLEDGTDVYHLHGVADGADVTDLLVGLVEFKTIVPVDIYVDTETRYPIRIVLTQPENVTEDQPEATTWTVDVYGINDAPELSPPADANIAELTEEPS